MDNIKEIKINCDAKNYANLDDFNELQGNLKDLTELNFNKLKLSILKYGFIAPLFAYKDNKGKLWIMDAHQRVRVLKHLRDVDGYLVPKLPYNLIQAKDKRQAKEMLLAINSRYGKMTVDGLYEFINEPKFEIDFENIKTLLDFSDINLDSFDLGYITQYGGHEANNLNENDLNIEDDFDPIGTATDLHKIVFIFDTENDALQFMQNNHSNLEYKKFGGGQGKIWQVNLSAKYGIKK